MSVNFPNVEPDSATFTLSYNTQTWSSDLNNAIQHRELAGARWIAQLTFTNRQSDTGAPELTVFVEGQRGGAGRFFLSPPDLNQRGELTGTPTVDGDGQLGSSLIVSGFLPNTTPLKAADYIEVNGELKRVSQDVEADLNGDATITFNPPLRRSPANLAPIEMIDPRGKFYLAENPSYQLSAPIIYGLTLNCVEDVN